MMRALLYALLALLLPATVLAGRHPRLLITPHDLPRLRHTCGVGTPAAGAGYGRFGAAAADFDALRAHFARRLAGEPLPGELAAAAFLHLVDADDPTEVDRIAFIRDALEKPLWLTTDPLELLIALDWTWDTLDPEARRTFLAAARRRAQPLSPADSPIEHDAFRRKLFTLAVALVVDEADEPSPAWALLRRSLLDAARTYFRDTLPTFVAWRGLSPTGPAVAAREESDTALAVELAGLLLENDVWTEQRPSIGRWLEHYLFAASTHPALQHQFLRDDGPGAPLLPVTSWNGLQPLTAHLIAARTRDPAAALVADRVAAEMRAPSADLMTRLWRWVPIVFHLRDVPRCDPQRLPIARNFDGAVVFRGGQGPHATVVWIEAGQPQLRRRQHFDAGHFLIHSGGHLIGGAGDDVTFAAVSGKGGTQKLGGASDPFDFEQFFVSTIAHNCLILYDALQAPRWYGNRFAPLGGQRLFERNCTEFLSPRADHPRATARQLAYGRCESAAYLALDLAPAYDTRAVAAYTREFIYLRDNLLLVVDRVQPANHRIPPTWVLNLPTRPTADGQELPADARIQGSDDHAGVWQLDQATWIRWNESDGAAWFASLLPVERRLFVVGGPARKLVIPNGPHAQRTYVGGEPDGFERLVIPATRRGSRNAWYRLGSPTQLGPQLGRVPHWGRIEIEPAQRSDRYLFVSVIVTDRADARRPPEITLHELDDSLELTIRSGRHPARLRLPRGRDLGGLLETTGPQAIRWDLPNDVEPDAPLPSEPGG